MKDDRNGGEKQVERGDIEIYTEKVRKWDAKKLNGILSKTRTTPPPSTNHYKLEH